MNNEIRDMLENGLNEDEKNKVRAQVQECSKEESEKEIKAIYDNCRRLFYDKTMSDKGRDIELFELTLYTMLSGEYAISLIENFDENIKNDYLKLMSKIKKAIKFAKEHAHLKSSPSLDDIFSKIDDHITGTIDGDIESRIREKYSEIERLNTERINALRDVASLENDKSSEYDAVYEKYDAKIRELYSEIDKLESKGIEEQLQKDDERKQSILSENNELASEYEKLYDTALWKFVEDEDCTEELGKMKKIKEEVNTNLEKM